MKKIIAFGASSSNTSINHQLALFAAQELTDIACIEIKLHEIDLPLYSAQLEKEQGIPKAAQELFALFQSADGFIISFAEHNGSFSAAYKNMYDWISRIDGNVFQSKALLLLATSPGARGGQRVLKHALELYSYGNKDKGVAASFSLPSFKENFIPNQGLKSPYDQDLTKVLAAFKTAL